jgi:phosphoenolpyruvate-protein phosphotransferase/dihydroxyacetone kinase phosphotransfer subunit
MVGLVIVSHSRALAKALVDLVRQVTAASIPLAVAAGVGEQHEEFGTDAVEIMEAIQSVYSPDGVLVLMDLGSAILSAETALELLPPEMANNVRFCPAPLVEGAIAAGVQVGLGSGLDAVCQEAKGALLPKIDQIGGEEGGAAPEGVAAQVEVQPAAEEVVLTLKNLHGLHARPAARFVQTAASFKASVRVRNQTTGKGPVSAKSLNALATLGAVRDHQIVVSADGPDASQALQALQTLVEGNFGERAEAEAPPPKPVARPAASAKGTLQAVPTSEGIALGPIYKYRPQLPPVPQERTEDPAREWDRLERALQATGEAIRKRRAQLATSLGEAELAIFDAHLLILQDPELQTQVHRLIFEEHQNAAAAWNDQARETAARYQALDDPYLKQRAADVLDVGNQVLFALADKADMQSIELPEPVILFANELTPTETSQLDMRRVLGLLTVQGGPTSHSAILARTLGIPAIAGVSLALEKLKDGTLLAMDGFDGTIWVEPPEPVQSKIKERREEWLEQRERLLKSSHGPTSTHDGHPVEIAANIGNVVDAEAAVRNGAEGVGLLRTEFLYLTRDKPPTEAEQTDSLRQIGQAMSSDGNAQRPIVVRTLDVGGDKELPYLPLAAEANPFLGVRAIRLSLRRPDLFQTQLRAILRAGEAFRFRIMFPMVANLDEVLEARRLLEEAHLALEAQGLAHRWPIEVGIMVEIPAAALLASKLAPQVDFFSIGTNDLTQYTLAAERGNPALSDMADALHPAVLRLVRDVVNAAHQHGKWVGVCGELAGDRLAVPVLVGLGVDELSMNPGAIPYAKAILRAIDLPEAQSLATKALDAESAQQARSLAQAFQHQHIGKDEH